MVIRGSFYFQIKGLRGTTGASERGVIFRFETISECVDSAGSGWESSVYDGVRTRTITPRIPGVVRDSFRF